MKEDFQGLQAMVYEVMSELYLSRNPARIPLLELKLNSFLEIMKDDVKEGFFYKKTSMKDVHSDLEALTPLELLLKIIHRHRRDQRCFVTLTIVFKDFNFDPKELLPIKTSMEDAIRELEEHFTLEANHKDLYAEITKIYAKIVRCEDQMSLIKEPKAIVPQYQLERNTSAAPPVSAGTGNVEKQRPAP